MRRLHRGAAARLAAELCGRGLHLLLIYAAQRTLGPELFGQFTFAVAVGLLAAVCTDAGAPAIVTREIARHPSDAPRIAGGGLALKLALTIPALLAILVIAATRPPGVRGATVALAAAMLAISFVEFAGYVLRGLDRVHQETFALLALRFATVAFGGTALWMGGGLDDLAVAYLLAASLALASIAGWMLARVVRPSLRLDQRTRGMIVRDALPLGGATILSIAFTRTPIFVLDAVHGAGVVGVYGVAQRLTEPLAIVPAALMAPALPAMSRSPGDATGSGVLAHSVRLLALAGVVVLVGGWLFGPAIVSTLYGNQFAGAAPVLQILAAAVLPSFVNYALTHALIARGRTHLNLIFNAAVFVLNLAMVWMLSGALGAPGAAAAIAASEMVLFGLCWTALRRAPAGGDAGAARQGW